MTKLRLMSLVIVVLAGFLLYRPIFQFVRTAPVRYRRAVLSAVRRDRRLAVQAGALSAAVPSLLVVAGLPAKTAGWFFFLGVALYLVAALLTWFGGRARSSADSP